MKPSSQILVQFFRDWVWTFKNPFGCAKVTAVIFSFGGALSLQTTTAISSFLHFSSNFETVQSLIVAAFFGHSIVATSVLAFCFTASCLSSARFP